MKRIFFRWLFLLLMTGMGTTACRHGSTATETDSTDSTMATDTTDIDSTLLLDSEDKGLSLDTHTTEVFGDFIFAFTHNSRFQAERVRFPLPVTELDGTERTIRSGRQFRSEFHLPGNEYYTLILGDRSQMRVLQSDTLVDNVTIQCIHLEQQTMTNYNFNRNQGRWFLNSCTHTPVAHELSSFFQFYEKFVTDTLFQQESIAEQLAFTMEDPDEEEDDIEGIIDRGQWPVFRPEMPGKEFVSIDFGQDYPNPHRLLFLQCGISDGMLDIFTFQREGERWVLTSYEN